MKKVNILFIGNSYSDDTVMYMPDLFADFKLNANVETLVYGGCTINQHIDFLTNHKSVYTRRFYNSKKHMWDQEDDVLGSKVIKSKKWDYISLQQASYESFIKDGISNINDLVGIVKKYCKNKDTKIIWNMTWPYPSTNEFEVFKDVAERNPLLMYKGITENVKKHIVNNPNFAMIIPNGTAIMNALSVVDEKAMYRDVVHLSFQYGRYIASLTAFMRIFNLNFDWTNVRPFSSLKETRTRSIAAANNAIKNPFEITPLEENK